SASDLAVPDDPTASRQPVFSKRAAIVCTCERAATSAAFSDFFSIFPSWKYLVVKLTQPMYRLSTDLVLSLFPMMNSVEPPPMSTTSRLWLEGGREWTTPR